jgi:TIR domain
MAVSLPAAPLPAGPTGPSPGRDCVSSTEGLLLPGFGSGSVQGMSVAGGGGIFVSYRREDSSDSAGRLSDRLIDHFGLERVFIDVDTIELGADFVEAITSAVDACAVLVAVIGPGWLSAEDEQGRRLDDPDDWVRVEIGTALTRGVRVIPVLVREAAMPRRGDLPADLAGLARRNPLRIRHESFRDDVRRLLETVEGVLVDVAIAHPGAPAAGMTEDSGPARSTSYLMAGNVDAAKWDKQKRLARATRLLHDAERIGKSIAAENRQVDPLIDVAVAVAASDPERAARLFSDAEQIVKSITDEGSNASGALARLARAVAPMDPDYAERIAGSIVDDSARENALGDVANVIVAIEPDRAERIANSITDDPTRAAVQQEIVAVMVAAWPDRAERIANSITREDSKARALGSVAAAAAVSDPDYAERIANSITDRSLRVQALSGAATAVAIVDPVRAAWFFSDAERIANSITHDGSRAAALGSVTRAMADVDPVRAERIANSIPGETARQMALVDVVRAVAGNDSGRAERIANSITHERLKPIALAEAARAIAATDPDRAERIANSITMQGSKARALSAVAVAVALTDPGRAERIADSLGGRAKEHALRDMAVAIAPVEPERAERIANSIIRDDWRALALIALAKAIIAQSAYGPAANRAS